MITGLIRFVRAQDQNGKYKQALKEIRLGKKMTHWMWYIFPQIKGLGYSETSKFYEIQSIQEAKNYIRHPILGKRLVKLSRELMELPTNNAVKVFGEIDSKKLQSSMTLFYIVSAYPVFKEVLNKYFNGEVDEKTVEILEEMWRK